MRTTAIARPTMRGAVARTLPACGLSARADESAVVLRRVHGLHALPGAYGRRHRGPRLRGHEVAQEVDVPADRHACVRRLGTVEAHELPHDIPIRDAHSARQLSVPPAIQPIARARAALVRRIKFPGFPIEER